VRPPCGVDGVNEEGFAHAFLKPLAIQEHVEGFRKSTTE